MFYLKSSEPWEPEIESSQEENLQLAADLISKASAIIFTTGAGMGVDSGMPDFRGKNGFWNAYPHFRERNLSFVDVAQPSWFEKDPRLAWGFYGHRLNMYRTYEPHEGYDFLFELSKEVDHFAITSNVDGFFTRSGIADENIWEIHGSIHHLQMLNPWLGEILSADQYNVTVDEKTFRATGDLPLDKKGNLLRPNILMFMDFGWIPNRAAQQREQFETWKEQADFSNLVIIECGAGTAIPTIRCIGGHLIDEFGGQRIRINPDDHQVLDGIGIDLGAEEALLKIREAINT